MLVALNAAAYGSRVQKGPGEVCTHHWEEAVVRLDCQSSNRKFWFAREDGFGALVEVFF